MKLLLEICPQSARRRRCSTCRLSTGSIHCRALQPAFRGHRLVRGEYQEQASSPTPSIRIRPPSLCGINRGLEGAQGTNDVSKSRTYWSNSTDTPSANFNSRAHRRSAGASLAPGRLAPEPFGLKFEFPSRPAILRLHTVARPSVRITEWRIRRRRCGEGWQPPKISMLTIALSPFFLED